MRNLQGNYKQPSTKYKNGRKNGTSNLINLNLNINFTNRRYEHIPVTINNQKVPYANTAKYLGMTLDAKLRWKAHVKKKREKLGLRYKKIYWLIGRNSSLSLHNKLLLYKQILKPLWTYGIQLWCCTNQSTSNRDIIQ
jgi:hypothetical protein